MIRVYMPWQNLGCFGVRVGRFYVDLFISPYVGIFYTNGRTRGYVRFWPRRGRPSKPTF